MHFGRATLVGLVIANMIGAGVFTTSGYALADLKTPERVLAAWAVGAVLALSGALSYGALARRMNESGGEYLFLSRAIHPSAGYVAGWVSLLAGFTGAIAFAATAFEAYVLPSAERPAWLPQDSVALALVVLAGLAHGHAATIGARAQNILVAFKLTVITAVVIYASLFTLPDAWRGGPLTDASGQVPPLQWSAFALTVMWISLSYSGFNAAVYVAGEARDSRRSVPRALVIGTALVSIIYLALNAIFVYAAAPASIAGREDVATLAAVALGGEGFGLAMRALIALALATSVSSMIMAGPRVYARMADDGVLPRVFRLQEQVPAPAIALQVSLAALVIVLSSLEELLSYLGFTLSLSAALTVASLFVLRAREGARAVPVPGYPWVPGLFVCATAGFAFVGALRRPAEALIGVATITIGLIAWWLTARRAARE